jgi:hypothetical protein
MSLLIVNNDTTLNYDGSQFVNNSTGYSAPLTITNAGDTQITITLNFSDNINNTNHYINIAGNNMTFEGLGIPIGVSVANYGGLIVNGSEYTDIIIQNIIIGAVGSGGLSSNAGWICSSFSNCTAYNCSSFGNVVNGGGIFGINSKNCIANNCHSNSNITGIGGGIFGSNSVNCTANKCFSTGNIIGGGGGIFGANSNNSETDATCTANGCYSSGLIGIANNYNNGGIFGPNCNVSATSSTCIANNCSSFGNIYGDNGGENGGIFGTNANTICTATDCYVVGNIGVYCGGIFSTATECTATNCYVIGNINLLAGGIFGISCTSCIATTCYSIGNINDQAGGIFGNSGVSCSAEACYSLGTIGSNAGSIFSSNSVSPTCTNCYVLNGTTSNLFGNGSSSTTTTNCVAENGGSWNDINATSTLKSGHSSSWFSAASNTPFLLKSFVNYTNLTSSGYQYFYVIPDTNTITSNGTNSYTFMTGYYRQEQDDSTIVSNDIYGYNLSNYNITVNVPAPVNEPFTKYLFRRKRQISEVTKNLNIYRNNSG